MLSRQVVLSTAEMMQRGLGLVNNRVFEALSCGAAVVVRLVFPHCCGDAAVEMVGLRVVHVREPTSCKIGPADDVQRP